MTNKFTMDTKRLIIKMLDPDCKTRRTFLDISQDDWLSDKSETKRRNYQLKKVYTKSRSKVVGTLDETHKLDNLKM